MCNAITAKSRSCPIALLILLTALMMGLSSIGFAQVGEAGTSTELVLQYAQKRVEWISGGLLVFALTALISMSILVYYDRPLYPLLRAFGLLLIICAVVLTVLAGAPPESLAAITGLLGTIAGYLLAQSPSTPPPPGG